MQSRVTKSWIICNVVFQQPRSINRVIRRNNETLRSNFNFPNTCPTVENYPKKPRIVIVDKKHVSDLKFIERATPLDNGPHRRIELS